mmetsp:Transcript_28687/g.78814  ORF Transcript_28687/g.78814 Transcript_28687/m.78814 type:complete len:266 (-) Transcript_28687:238-1035(-)
MSWQTTIRQQLLEPLLPPPAVAFVRDTADPLFAEWGLGTEGTVTLLTTLLAAYLTYTVLKLVLLSISSSNSSSGAVSAIVDDNDTAQQQRQLQQQRRYHSTVVLCGPAHAGKTRLFYQLCYPNTSKSKQPVLTLTSLQPNVGVNKDNGVRYIDLPGHSMGNNNNSTTTALLNRAFAETKKETPPSRLDLGCHATRGVCCRHFISTLGPGSDGQRVQEQQQKQNHHYHCVSQARFGQGQEWSSDCHSIAHGVGTIVERAKTRVVVW